MKITKSQLKAIIKEEALKFKRAIELKKEIAEIDKQLTEVKAGSVMEPGTGGVHAGQKKPVFATKDGNPNLKMEDGIEGDEASIDVDVDNLDADVATMDADVATDAPSGEMMSKDEVRSAIHALEDRLGLHGGPAKPEVGAEVGAEIPGEEGEEEFEFDTNEPSDEAGAEEKPEGGEEVSTEAKPEEEEEKEVTMEAKPTEENVVKETVEEPTEGSSPAQEAKEKKESAPFDEKTKHIKEGTEPTIAESERSRMAFLAGIVLKG